MAQCSSCNNLIPFGRRLKAWVANRFVTCLVCGAVFEPTQATRILNTVLILGVAAPVLVSAAKLIRKWQFSWEWLLLWLGFQAAIYLGGAMLADYIELNDKGLPDPGRRFYERPRK